MDRRHKILDRHREVSVLCTWSRVSIILLKSLLHYVIIKAIGHSLVETLIVLIFIVLIYIYLTLPFVLSLFYKHNTYSSLFSIILNWFKVR